MHAQHVQEYPHMYLENWILQAVSRNAVLTWLQPKNLRLLRQIGHTEELRATMRAFNSFPQSI
jgi:hypothetical protein